MVAILGAAGGIAPDRLQMRLRIGSVENVLIGRRHCQPFQPVERALIAQRPAAAVDVDEAAAVAATTNAELGCGDVAQAELAQQALWRPDRRSDFGHGRNECPSARGGSMCRRQAKAAPGGSGPRAAWGKPIKGAFDQTAARGLSCDSAILVSFWSAAFSSCNVCSSMLAQSLRPSCFAQAISVP